MTPFLPSVYMSWGSSNRTTASETTVETMFSQSLTFVTANTSTIDQSIENRFPIDILYTALLATVLSLMIVCTAIGNMFVIIAILMERHLQRPQNYLIVSLACADMSVGLGVLPLSAVYELTNRQWQLGSVLCDVWTFADVTACSASILNLVAISVDRYLSITDVHYSQQRDVRKIYIMIGAVWLLSLLISIPPIIGWKDYDYYRRIDDQICLLSQDTGFQIFSTTTAFYVPLILIISMYTCIYRAAKARIRRKSDIDSFCAKNGVNGATPAVADGELPSPMEPTTGQLKIPTGTLSTTPTTTSHTDCSKSTLRTRLGSTSSLTPTSQGSDGRRRLSIGRLSIGNLSIDSKMSNVSGMWNRRRSTRTSQELKRERKAFHTLAIITGTFIFCWLPFFVTALVRPLCGCEINPKLEAIFNWLGWSNSLLNPIIYTVFSPDFRNAFRKILLRIFPCQGRRKSASKYGKKKKIRSKTTNNRSSPTVYKDTTVKVQTNSQDPKVPRIMVLNPSSDSHSPACEL